jgi:hypothetical protein
LFKVCQWEGDRTKSAVQFLVLYGTRIQSVKISAVEAEIIDDSIDDKKNKD